MPVKNQKYKKCLKIIVAVITSHNLHMHTVTLGLANLALHVGLTSSLWSLRQFVHLRKAVPSAVRSITCLRPVSLVCDMAHAIDAVWIQRNRGQWEFFAGPCQLGGVSGAVLLVLAVVVLAQAREYFGLSTFLVTLDLKRAFDMAPLDCMKLACMEAGLSLES